MFSISTVIIGIILVLLFPLIKRNIMARTYYSHRWKKSSSFTLKDFLKERPPNLYYYKRPEDELITINLKEKKSTLIVGQPLAGKTRAVFQALINSQKPYDVLIPRCIDISPDSFLIPYRITGWRSKIIFIDDLHRFVEQKSFETLFEATIRESIPIIATCRSEIEYKKSKKIMLEKNINLEIIFGEKIIEIERISESIAKYITDKVDINWETVKFDGTIGSIFMPFSEMNDRFLKCSDEEKTIMRGLKLLYISGIYNDNQIFPIAWIKVICKKYRLEKTLFEWDELLRKLKEKELVKLEGDSVFVEETYLENIITMETEMSNHAVLEEMFLTYKGNNVALSKLGARAYSLGKFNIESAKYMHIAVQAFKDILGNYNKDKLDDDYADIQINLGIAYRHLANAEDCNDNCNKAIQAYKEALKVFNKEKSPLRYALTLNNLGTAYGHISEYMGGNKDNCNRAIQAFMEALEIFKKENNFIECARIQNNIGNTYSIIADIEDKSNNCIRAIEAYKDALKIRTLDRFPDKYAMTQYNLGVIYGKFVDLADSKDNCKKAIQAFKNALKVINKENFPMQFAATHNNLGISYGKLSHIEDKKDNCKRAIQAFKKALKIYSKEKFPNKYKSTLNNQRMVLSICENGE